MLASFSTVAKLALALALAGEVGHSHGSTGGAVFGQELFHVTANLIASFAPVSISAFASKESRCVGQLLVMVISK